MKELMSLNYAEGAIDQILQKASTEITWFELKKFKAPFVSRQIHMMGEKVIELERIKGDDKHKSDKIEPEDEVEPVACTKDSVVPNQIATK